MPKAERSKQIFANFRFFLQIFANISLAVLSVFNGLREEKSFFDHRGIFQIFEGGPAPVSRSDVISIHQTGPFRGHPHVSSHRDYRKVEYSTNSLFRKRKKRQLSYSSPSGSEVAATRGGCKAWIASLCWR
jgi:hypothetical protein